LTKKNEVLAKDKSELIQRYLLELSEDDALEKDDTKFAMLLLGIMHYIGRGVNQNYSEAVRWYEKAADKLDSYGLCNLGYCYYYGRDIPIDYEKAYSSFSQSSFLGNPNAMYKLGDMFDKGFHVIEDKNAAFFWYREAHMHTKESDIERPNIEYRLGKCFLYGKGVEQNLYTALTLLQNAEFGFFRQIDEGDSFAELTLPSVRNEIDNV